MKAANLIFAILPKNQADDFIKIWQDFELGMSTEAKFAKALDRVQPVLLHDLTDGVVWEKYGTTISQITEKMQTVRTNTPCLWPRVRAIMERATKLGRLKE